MGSNSAGPRSAISEVTAYSSLDMFDLPALFSKVFRYLRYKIKRAIRTGRTPTPKDTDVPMMASVGSDERGMTGSTATKPGISWSSSQSKPFIRFASR